MTIYKPSIYKGAGIYKTGAGGGGGGEEQLAINGFSYGIVQINNLLWINSDLKSLFNGIAFAPSDKWYLGAAAKIYDNDVAMYGVYGQNRGLLYNAACRTIIQNWLDTNYPGWRIPKIQDYTNIINFCGGYIPAFNKLCEARLWPDLEYITNEFGFNAIPTGRVYSGNFSNAGSAYYMTSESGSPFSCSTAYYINNNSKGFTDDTNMNANYDYFALRLCKDA